MGNKVSNKIRNSDEVYSLPNTVYSLEFKMSCKSSELLENPEFWKKRLENIMIHAVNDKLGNSQNFPPIFDIAIEVYQKNKKYTSGLLTWRSVIVDKYALAESLTVFLMGTHIFSNNSYKIIPYRYKFSDYQTV